MMRVFLKDTVRPWESAGGVGVVVAAVVCVCVWRATGASGMVGTRGCVCLPRSRLACEATVLDDLQQHVEHVRVRLLDLVKEHHAERLAPATRAKRARAFGMGGSPRAAGAQGVRPFAREGTSSRDAGRPRAWSVGRT